MIRFFSGKIKLGSRKIFYGTRERNPVAEEHHLKRAPIEYFKMLYADTAVNGEPAATRCGHSFFGTRFSLFATDAPFDAEQGRGLIRETIADYDLAVHDMEDTWRYLAALQECNGTLSA